MSFTTDDYGYETSFKVLGEFDNIIAEEPGSGESFNDNTDYTYQYCLTSGFQYRLRFDDGKKDGFVSVIVSCLTCYLLTHDSRICFLQLNEVL